MTSTVRFLVLAALLVLGANRVALGAAPTTDANILAMFHIGDPLDGILVPVYLGHSRYDFTVDTGSDLTVYDTRLRQYLGERVSKAVVATRELELYRAPVARLGPIEVPPAAPVACVDLQLLRDVDGADSYGVLGMDVLSKHVIRIDFDRGETTFYRQVPSDSGVRVALRFTKHGVPVARAGFGDAPPLPFFLDTGFYGSNGVDVDGRVFDTLVKFGDVSHVSRSLVTSFDANRWTRRGRLALFTFYDHMHHQLVVGESDANRIGLAFLSRYVVTFDFPHGTMYLLRARGHSNGDLDDLSGLHLIKKASTVIADAVDDDSVAASAGMRSGDILIGINNQATEHLRMSRIRRMLATPGVIEISFRRGNSRQYVTIVLTAQTAGPAAANSRATRIGKRHDAKRHGIFESK